MEELKEVVIKRLIEELKDKRIDRTDLLTVLKDLLYVILEYQRKERMIN